MIILERDGTLHHQPPADQQAARRATVSLDDDQAEPSMLDKLIDFTFDVLGISNLEVRVYEHPKR